tara:strand:- start:677 stop:2152 length:1476 start_codon:yes stop_codon:yes gene_type:complete
MVDVDKIIQEVSPYYKKKKEPSCKHQLVYNSSTETLEPIYFWILDFTSNLFGGNVEKIMDNFSSSPGSGHFSELQGKVSHMQQEASRVLGTVNTILKGVINLIYDLKEFKIRLSHYDNANSKDKSKSEAGLLALKQMWLDKVDVNRGQGSIHAMSAGNLNFVTLRDAFLSAESVSQVDKIDLNERVKRILKPRLQEFFEWKKRSESELRKRFEIEKTYLKSQTDSLKLNARWAKPYLKAAEQLNQSTELASNPALVNIFNTVLLELTILCKSPLDVEQAVVDKDLPNDFKKIRKLRTYNSVVVVDFSFRGIPNKAGQHYVFGGKADVKFRGYALNDEEIELLRAKLSDSDLEDSLRLVQGMTDDSLAQLKLDIEEFLPDEVEKAKEKQEDDINPFSALFSFVKPKKKEKKDDKEKEKENIEKLKKKGVVRDKYPELYIRRLAEAEAINKCYTVFDVYKKAHGMASLPFMEDVEIENPRSKAEEVFGLNKPQ